MNLIFFFFDATPSILSDQTKYKYFYAIRKEKKKKRKNK